MSPLDKFTAASLSCGLVWNLPPRLMALFPAMSEVESELLGAVSLVATAFETLRVDYFVGGSVASSVFGEPRQTLDADLVAHLLGPHAEPLVERLGAAFYADLPAIQTAIESQGSFNLIHLDSMTKVDVFVHAIRLLNHNSTGARKNR